MLSTVSIWFRGQMLQASFRNQQISPNCYIALCRSVPETNSRGDLLIEPPANFGYARQPYSLVAQNWEVGARGGVVNTKSVSFGTTTGDWGVLQGWALVNAASGGELIASGPLVPPRRVGFGTPVLVRERAIAFSLGDAGA